MFDNLSNRLEAIYKKLKGRGKLKEADVDEALRDRAFPGAAVAVGIGGGKGRNPIF